jgi:hypothetical protein
MRRYLSLGVCLIALCQGAVNAQTTFTPGTDITSSLQSAINSGQNGLSPYSAVITLPAGNFIVSASINLHGSTLQGAGASKTFIEFKSDLGSGKVGFTGDCPATYGPFEIDNLTIQGPRPAGTVPIGESPNSMDGIHLYDECVLRKVDVNYFHEGVIIDGNHHTLDTVTAQTNYDGIAYVISSDGTYFDDYIVDCSFTSDQRSGVYVSEGAIMGGVTLIRTHTGFEPYAFLLGHGAFLGSSTFLQTMFEGVGNADIADLDGTSEITNNYFTNCSGWGGRYNVAIAGQPTTPSLRCGYFMENTIVASGDMGPEPGDMSATGSVKGNTWTCDESLLTSIANGSLTPIACASVSDNLITSCGDQIELFDVTKPVRTGQAVEISSGRVVSVMPATGAGSVLGVSLSNILVGQVAWVVERGIVGITCDTGATITFGKWLKVDAATSLAMPAVSATDGESIGIVAIADGTTPVPTRISF